MSYNKEAYLEPRWISTTKIFGENSKWFLAVNYFHKKIPS